VTLKLVQTSVAKNRPSVPTVSFRIFEYTVHLTISPTYSVVTDELSSSGDSKADDDADKKSPKDKDSKDRERDREEG